MEFQKILVTPEIARGYLTRNKNNRRVKKAHLIRLSNDMKKGLWKEETAEMIKISNQGNILDGQHRLLAVIESNVSIYFHFAIGLKDEVFSVLDTGSLRNASDSFYVSGVKNSTSVPAMISLHYGLKNGNKDHYAQKYTKLTNFELLEKYNERSDFWDNVATNSVKWYQSFAKILAPQIIGGIYSLISDVDSEKGLKFMNELCTGYDISNPVINVLRNSLIKDKMNVRKMPMDLKLAMIIKCWNFYKENKTTKILKWDSGSEKFPQI
jgi:hypothetical protein